MRKYNISATIVLQDISQLMGPFKDEWRSIMANCSTIVNLGTSEPETLKYFMGMLGEKTIRTRSDNMNRTGSSQGYSRKGRSVMTAFELSTMPHDECIVFTAGRRPVRDKKYEYMNHPYYPYTGDCRKELIFNYKKLSVYNNGMASKIQSILRAHSTSKAYLDRQRRLMEDERRKRQAKSMDVYDALDQMSAMFSDEENRRAYGIYMQKCIEMASAQKKEGREVPVVMLDDAPKSWLFTIAKQACDQLGLSSAAVFTKLTSMNAKYDLGIAYSKEDSIDSRLIDNAYVVSHAREKGCEMIAIKPDSFKNYVLEAGALTA